MLYYNHKRERVDAYDLDCVGVVDRLKPRVGVVDKLKPQHI